MSLWKVGNRSLRGRTQDTTLGWEGGGTESTGDHGGMVSNLD